MVPIFILAVFLNAALLFLVQPMVGKLLLPKLGGTPAVWNTCLVFFQLALLAGYAYAWLQGRLKTHASRVIVHVLLLGSAAAFLPIASGASLQPPTDRLPTWWLLWTLLTLVGVPFIAISTTGPLLQRWFSDSTHRHASDPYFLYAASNAGSLLGLMAYPFLIERTMTLSEQRLGWSLAYAVAAVLTIVCGVMVLKRLRPAPSPAATTGAPVPLSELHPIPPSRKLMWVVLAAAPSSLSMGCTQHLTTDMAAMPLLWVAPLAVYLLSFVLAFSKNTQWLSEPVAWAVPIFAALVFYTKTMGNALRMDLAVQFNLLLLLAGAWACHGKLAGLRPHASRLTEYFVWLAVGGALGGMFNALVAPVIFKDVWEYPIAIAAVIALTLPSLEPAVGAKLAKRATVAGRIVLVLAVVAAAVFTNRISAEEKGFIVERRERTFFGVHRVAVSPDRVIRELLHGTTTHGAQMVRAMERTIPRTYYHAQSSIGRLFKAVLADGRPRRLAAIGLGTGTLAYYSAPDPEPGKPAVRNHMTFYEIDPVIVDIANDTRHFTYIDEAKKAGGTIDYVLGDARQTLQTAQDGIYDIILLDAFSSDAIPMHLLTREAIDLYFKKLAPGGVVALHISNRHLDLAIMLRELAHRAGLVAIGGKRELTMEQWSEGMFISAWILMTRTPEDAKVLLDEEDAFRRIDDKADGSVEPWTDDFSNILDVMK